MFVPPVVLNLIGLYLELAKTGLVICRVLPLYVMDEFMQQVGLKSVPR